MGKTSKRSWRMTSSGLQALMVMIIGYYYFTLEGRCVISPAAAAAFRLLLLVECVQNCNYCHTCSDPAESTCRDHYRLERTLGPGSDRFLFLIKIMWTAFASSFRRGRPCGDNRSSGLGRAGQSLPEIHCRWFARIHSHGQLC